MAIFASIHFAEGFDNMGFLADRPSGRRHHVFYSGLSGLDLSVDNSFQDIFLGEDADWNIVIRNDDSPDVLCDHHFHHLENRRRDRRFRKIGGHDLADFIGKHKVPPEGPSTVHRHSERNFAVRGRQLYYSTNSATSYNNKPQSGGGAKRLRPGAPAC